MSATCETCPAWRPDETRPGFGACKAESPVFRSSNGGGVGIHQAEWPITPAAEWCMVHPDNAGAMIPPMPNHAATAPTIPTAKKNGGKP